jgi:hypothetical protein
MEENNIPKKILELKVEGRSSQESSGRDVRKLGVNGIRNRSTWQRILKKMLVCKVGLRTIILRDNVIRKH